MSNQHQYYRILVKNIANQATDEEIFSFFKQIGPFNIKESQIEKITDNGNNKTTAKIAFYDQESVYIAEKYFQQHNFKGRPLTIQFYHDSSSGRGSLQSQHLSSETTLKNLHESKKVQLMSLLSEFMVQKPENQIKVKHYLDQHKGQAEQVQNMVNNYSNNSNKRMNVAYQQYPASQFQINYTQFPPSMAFAPNQAALIAADITSNPIAANPQYMNPQPQGMNILFNLAPQNYANPAAFQPAYATKKP